MDVLKICGFAIISVLLWVIIKQYKSEFAAVFAIGVCCIVSVYAVKAISPYFNMLTQTVGENVITAIKALGIGFITELVSSFARDEGLSSLAYAVTVLGRVSLIILAIPLIKQLLDTAVALC